MNLLFKLPNMITLSLQVEFEDKKIKDFKEFKESGIAPFGQAPLLEVCFLKNTHLPWIF